MSRDRIDVHQHIVPPAYAETLAGKGLRDAPEIAVTDFTSQRDAHELGGAPQAIDRGNAEALFPRLASPRKEIP